MTETTRGVSAALQRALPFFISALVCTIAGGLLAAATAYAPTQKTVWATAYIVLVAGVAQGVLGAAMGWLAPNARLPITWTAFLLFTFGNAGVLIGQFTGLLAITFVAGAMLMIALVLIVIATHRDRAPAHPAALWTFRAIVIVLAVSVPVGLVLAALGD